MSSTQHFSRRGPLSHEVTDWLRERIVSGQWKRDERIPSEFELMEQLQVSRGTLREAIKALSHAGMLEVLRGDGTYVRAANEFDGAAQQVYREHKDTDVLQLRFALDTQAARLAALRADAGEMAKLRELLDDRRRAWHAGDIQAWIDADWKFHLVVAEASGNRLLHEVYTSFNDIFHGTKMHQRLLDGFDGCLAAGHEELLGAIEARDEKTAAASVLANLEYCMSWAQRD
ncbi:FadR/GntR family transcriptional regulator [Arthrobacter sp. LS16]|uniref:FCD domain-containing protein n=1 Tax=Glutamicibacter soli TaxID=453836 RepID=A0A6L9GCX0_9MICC|nr:FCD domain-containing protein [Glutamicibacter soli]NAZ17156.1 FCD domain-containing protein [Glutamicibacter soli]